MNVYANGEKGGVGHHLRPMHTSRRRRTPRLESLHQDYPLSLLGHHRPHGWPGTLNLSNHRRPLLILSQIHQSRAIQHRQLKCSSTV